MAATAPVKAPFSWPKSSVSRSSRASPAQFKSTNGSSARGALPVEPAGEHALARARLALDQHGDGRGDDPGRLGGELADGRALAEERVHGLAQPARTCPPRTLPHPPVLEGALDDHQGAGSSTGLVRNCSAPSLMAFTARSMVPWPVSRTTGSEASCALSAASTSRPSPSAREKSTIAASRPSAGGGFAGGGQAVRPRGPRTLSPEETGRGESARPPRRPR